jgi:hypothetical protein
LELANFTLPARVQLQSSLRRELQRIVDTTGASTLVELKSEIEPITLVISRHFLPRTAAQLRMQWLSLRLCCRRAQKGHIALAVSERCDEGRKFGLWRMSAGGIAFLVDVVR